MKETFKEVVEYCEIDTDPDYLWNEFRTHISDDDYEWLENMLETVCDDAKKKTRLKRRFARYILRVLEDHGVTDQQKPFQMQVRDMSTEQTNGSSETTTTERRQRYVAQKKGEIKQLLDHVEDNVIEMFCGEVSQEYRKFVENFHRCGGTRRCAPCNRMLIDMTKKGAKWVESRKI